MAGFNLKQAMAGARDKVVRKPQGDVIVSVTTIGDKTITGTVMTGPAKGAEIEFLPAGHLGIADFKKGKSKTVEGGTLRVEGLREGRDGVYTCRWAKTFVGKPSDTHVIKYDQPMTLIETSKRDRNDAKIMFVQALDLEAATDATAKAQVREKIAEGLKSHGGVHVFGVDGGEFTSLSIRLRSSMKDGVRVLENADARADEKVAALFGDAPEADVNAYLATNPLSIVPTNTAMLGSDTSAGIETKLKEAEESGKPANIPTVNPADFQPLSIGTRIQIAMASKRDEIPDEIKAKFKDLFLASASQEARDAFQSKGWASVSDVHLTEFFKSQGVELKVHPTVGWSNNAIVLQKREDNPAADPFATKTFRTGGILPYPPVKVTEGLRKDYLNEMHDKVVALVTPHLQKDVVAKVEEKAIATAKEQIDETPADAITSAESELDAFLLENLGDKDMTLDPTV